MNYSSVFEQFFMLFFVWCFTIYSVSARKVQYPGDGYYNGNVEDVALDVDLALEKLEQTPKWVQEWPDPSIQFGQVSGLALDNSGHLLVFHRGPNVWDERTFSLRDVYQNIGEPPIARPTIMVLNDTGHLVDSWGQNLFYMPHGITVDHEGNVWLTDVALHQVFKFTPHDRQKPAMVLGEKFVPGNDDAHLCKPSAVAVLASGDFFVADGYCNHRILKYSRDGQIILQWGKALGRRNDPFVLTVPHALTLAEERELVCVANRERGNVACFRTDNGTFVSSYSSWLIGPRVFSVAYTPAHGGLLYVVNGPTVSQRIPVRGYVLDLETGRLRGSFAPPNGLANPHDVVASRDGSRVYVAELSPFTVHKFVREPGLPTAEPKPNATHGKPTAVVEGVSRARDAAPDAVDAAWRWGAGGAGAAAALALLALAARALRAARDTGERRRADARALLAQ